MASLVLGVVGAVVGSFIAPGIGTAIGWSLGSALGGLIDPPKSEGPRLSDLKLQGSAYGSFIGIPYGRVRLAGEVIWQTDLTEHSHTEGGGKGGGPEVTTFTYTASFAIQICEGPVTGVFKIWGDSRILLSVDDFGAVVGKLPITVYLGTESQLPDPTMEAVEGVGNVPAHRGYCYVVFTDLELADYGNRIPSFTFEVATSHGDIPWRVSTFDNPNSVFAAGPIAQGAQNGQIENGQLVIGTYPYPSATNTVAFYASRYSLDGTLISVDDPIIGDTLDQRLAGGTNTEAIIQCQNNYHIAIARLGGSGNTGNTSAFIYDGITGITPIHPPIGTDNQSAIMGKPFYYQSNPLDGSDPIEYLYGTGGGSGDAFVGRWPVTDGVPSSGTPSVHYVLPGDAEGWGWFVTVDENGIVWVCGPDPGNVNGQLFKFDADLNVLYHWLAADNPLPETVHCFTVFNNTILFPSDIGGATNRISAYYINDDGTFTLAGHTLGLFSNILSLGSGLGLTADGIVSINPPPLGERLSAIVADISTRCGLSLYDVDELTDIVDGFTVGSPVSGRAAIETLMPVYFFDGVESDGAVKFVKRGHEPVATIAFDELAAMESGGDSFPAPIDTARAADDQLPSTVSITYFNKDADYLNATQTQRRQTGGSLSPVTLEVPLVLTDSKAKQVADALLYHPWLERSRRSFKTTRKYLALEPTDVVTVTGLDLRITQKKEDAAGVIQFEAVPSISSIYTQSSVSGPSGGFTAPVPASTTTQVTQLAMLDIPLVDDDDSEGFYAAMAGATAAWRGAALFRSSDGGASYSEIGRSLTADVMGTASTLLGDFLGGDVIDELNNVTVVIGSGGGTLSSTTNDAMLFGANKALLGNEILQYRDAALTAASTYRLSGLLRGRRGTEWAIGTHGSNERFIALPVALNIASSVLNTSYLFKAVTLGSTLASTTAATFATTGAAVRPYSVTQIGGGFNASGDCIMNWMRRTRIGGSWSGYVDVPLSESSEMYTVEIWDSTFATLVRTISGLTTPTATYTAAQQTADFGSTQSIVYAKLYQNGRLPSRGVRAHFPNNSLSWTSDLEPTPGPLPPPALLRTIPFTWADAGQTLQKYSADYGGFSATDSISVSFTTPSGTSTSTGRITVVEFSDPPVERVACFSTVSGDFETGLAGPSKQVGIGITFLFSVGAAVPYMLQLAPSTTYYLNLRNGVTTYQSCNIQVTLQKPAGL